MKVNLSSEMAVLREIASAVARERNVRKLLNEVIAILENSMGMLRGTFALLEGDELRIEASTRTLNSEERALGRYHIGEGITGLVAKTGRAEVVVDVRKDKRFLNRTKARKINEPLSFVCVPLIHGGQVIGTLSVDREMTGDTKDLVRDVALLEIIANLCAEAASVCREECAEQNALLEENVRLNYSDAAAHRVFCQDAFDFFQAAPMRYETIVLDPPAFAKHRESVENALKGYRRINRAALRNIAPGGFLFTFSCSQLVSPELFREAVFSAAAQAGRDVRVLHVLHQGADHPVNLFHPESEYLKGLVLEVR